MDSNRLIEVHGSNSPATIDPVCGMTVDPATAAGQAAHEGRTYHFCSIPCRDRFEADPERYLRGRAAEPVAPASSGAVYTCPMHPEIVRDEPGACPICGMALEPRTVTAQEAPSAELVNMTRRFWIAAVLALPVFLVAMSDLIPGSPLHFLDMHVLNWVQLVLATPVVVWCGWPFFERAWA